MADFNNDGIQDLLVFKNVSGSTALGVKFGNGSGAFGPTITSPGPANISSVVVRDFDNDGKLDLGIAGVVAIDFQIVTPAVVTMLGDGAGHFTKKSEVLIAAVGITAADFNSDAKLDLAITDGGTKVATFSGDGAGNLVNPVEADVGGNPNFPGNFGLAAADFDGNTKPDLAVANRTQGTFVLRNLCAAAPSISGRVTDVNTVPIGGVTVTISGTQSATAQTDNGGNYFIGNLTAGGNYIVTPSKENFRFNPTSININNLSGSQTANFVGTPITIQFTQNHHLVSESAISVQIGVSRSGDLSGVSTVDFETVNGSASDRSDFTRAVGTLRFGPGESLKSFEVLLTDDALVEGFESLTLKLSNPTGAIFTAFPGSTVLMEIQDNDFAPGPNPINNSAFFVRQHYHDFLNREPDAAGLAFWVNEIESCGTDQACREIKRINVSAAFFLSIEFQETGYLVYRTYKTAFGDTTSPNVQIPVPIIRLTNFCQTLSGSGLECRLALGIGK